MRTYLQLSVAAWSVRHRRKPPVPQPRCGAPCRDRGRVKASFLTARAWFTLRSRRLVSASGDAYRLFRDGSPRENSHTRVNYGLESVNPLTWQGHGPATAAARPAPRPAPIGGQRRSPKTSRLIRQTPSGARIIPGRIRAGPLATLEGLWPPPARDEQDGAAGLCQENDRRIHGLGIPVVLRVRHHVISLAKATKSHPYSCADGLGRDLKEPPPPPFAGRSHQAEVSAAGILIGPLAGPAARLRGRRAALGTPASGGPALEVPPQPPDQVARGRHHDDPYCCLLPHAVPPVGLPRGGGGAPGGPPPPLSPGPGPAPPGTPPGPAGRPGWCCRPAKTRASARSRSRGGW